ncbi:hypothetical protein [Bacteroides sp.]|uniref:hypothetical protein n=1 Tax=Bacteroides sp. TaxID=29523 RepID=UPI00262AECA2|nr:hypothetical protein [Bacteroides sp.]
MGTNIYSFHHGVHFVPPWWKEMYTVVERNFLHDGTNKALPSGYLTIAAMPLNFSYLKA